MLGRWLKHDEIKIKGKNSLQSLTLSLPGDVSFNHILKKIFVAKMIRKQKGRHSQITQYRRPATSETALQLDFFSRFARVIFAVVLDV